MSGRTWLRYREQLLALHGHLGPSVRLVFETLDVSDVDVVHVG